MKLLLIEDDRTLAASLTKNLKAESFVVDHAFDGIDGEELASISNYDCILLDIRLPKQDGIVTCKHLRKQGILIPILMLTALDDVTDKVRGLDSGADDYLTKPFSVAELAARIRALSRRQPLERSTVIERHGVVLDPAAHSVRRDGIAIPLGPREFAFLELLITRCGRIVSRDTIMEQLWDMNADPCSNVIDAQIKLLRRKIDKGFPFPLIHTIRGFGYRFGPERCE
jgi:two-component system OmpR family response regulator